MYTYEMFIKPLIPASFRHGWIEYNKKSLEGYEKDSDLCTA